MERRIATVTFLVRDYDEARDYFVGRLRFSVIADTPMGGGRRWLVVAPPGAGGGAGLLLAKAATAAQEAAVGRQAGGRVFLFLQTDDFWRDHRMMTAAGVEFVESPREEAYGTVAVFVDLYGNRWDLLQLGTTVPPEAPLGG